MSCDLFIHVTIARAQIEELDQSKIPTVLPKCVLNERNVMCWDPVWLFSCPDLAIMPGCFCEFLLALFGVLPMVPLVSLPMVPLAYQWYHWLTNGSNGTIGRANGTIGITIGTNGKTNGTIGRTLNDIGIPLVEP